MFKDKKVLITGGSGMVGRALVDLLLKEGAKITVVDIHIPQDLSEDVDFYQADLRHFQDCLDACKGMNYVFHLAGIKGSPKMSTENPASFMIPMLQFNTNMMEAARMADVDWYLYTSSVGVYSPAEVFYEDDVWSTFPSTQDTFAGWAKRIGELQAKAYSIQYRWDKVSIVRPANVYGPYDNFDPNTAMVIPSLISKAFKEEVLNVWGNGSAIRDFIFSEDVAAGMIHMVKNKVTEPVNLGSGTGHTIKYIAEYIAKQFEKEIKWDISKPTGELKRILSDTRARSKGFITPTPIEKGIDKTIDWFIDNQETLHNRFNAF